MSSGTNPTTFNPVLEPLESRRLLAAYYVSVAGNDNANGLSPQAAWRTIDRANQQDFNPGDSLLFEGGKTFAAQGVTGPNLVANPGFDAGLATWDAQGTNAANSVITPDRTGVGSALTLKGNGGTRAQDVTASIAPGRAYKMGVWMKVDSPGGAFRRVGISFSLNGQSVGTFYRGGVRNTTWAETDWAFVAPPQFDKASVWVTKGAGDASQFHVDDFVLQSLPNGIVFDANDSGTTVAPVTVASYGVGKATIAAGDGIGFWGGNVAGVRIQNLKFAGTWDSSTGTGGNVGVGIDYVNTRTDSSKLEYVTVEKCDVSGFQWAGIRVGGWAAKSGFRLALITDSVVRGNGDVGIVARGEYDKAATTYANEKVYVARSKVYSNTGIPDKGTNSGSGVLLSDVFMGTVERTVAHHNGALNNSEHGGPIGIWAFDASKITLQYSESYENKTGSTRDGAGFDFDSGVVNSVMQHNYSHDNDGAGYLLGHFDTNRSWGRNVVRNNISQNDGRKNSYGGITLSGAPGPYNVVIEHNTVFMSPSAAGGSQAAIRLKWAGTGVNVRNNVFHTTGAAAIVDADKNAPFAQFHGNVYWNPKSVKIRWNGASYGTLDAWRAASGRELLGTTPTGLQANPQLAAPATGGTLGDAYKLNTLTMYRPLPTSPLINAAVFQPTAYKGYAPTEIDFFGIDVRNTNRDIGAAELG